MSTLWFNSLPVGNIAWLIAADLVVKSTILLLLVLVAHALLGRRRVLFRSGLWNAALAALLVLPAFAMALPRRRVDWLPTVAFSTVRVQAVSEKSAVALHADRMIARADPLRPSSSSASAVVSRGLDPESTRRPVQDVVISFWTLFVVVYLAGVLILTLRLLASVSAVGRLKRTAREVDDSRWTEAFGRWRHRLRINRPVKLVHSGRVRVPLVVGWRRPAIVLPLSDEDRDRATETEIGATLIHELAHLCRRDDLWNLVQQIVQVVYWPNPLIWLAARLIAGVREQACDDLCVRWVGSAREYRAVLLAVASRLVGPSGALSVTTSVGLAMARGPSTALSGRLSWIDRTRGSSSCILHWPGRLGIAMIVLGLASLLAVVELGRRRASQPIPSSDDSAPQRAYDSPVPDSANLQTVTLTVVDDETGKPLPGVEVQVLNYVDSQWKSFPTDRHGRLRFEYPSIGKPSLNMELRKNGYVPVRRGWGFREPEKPPLALTMKLRRGTTMGGIVVYAEDKPVEGVTVVMTVNKYGPDKRPENPTGYEMYFEVPSRTGPDGRWRTDSVPPGAELVQLQLIHPDFVSDGSTMFGPGPRSPTLSALRDQTDRQVLTKGVKISGRVVDDKGQPIAGAGVVESTQGLTFLRYVRRALTDAEGRFHFHFGRGGPVSLTVQVKGYEPKTKVVLREQDARPLEFRLPPGKSLRARVVDAKGKPIAAASVVIPGHAGEQKGIYFRRWTDSQGRFEWDSAPAESVAYSIGADGYVGVDSIVLTAGEKEAVVVLKPALSIRLRVIDAETRKPIQTFGIQIGRANPDGKDFRWGQPTSGSFFNGEYRTSLEPENGPYQIRVIANGYSQVQTRVFRGEEKSVRETIALPRLAQPPSKE